MKKHGHKGHGHKGGGKLPPMPKGKMDMPPPDDAMAGPPPEAAAPPPPTGLGAGPMLAQPPGGDNTNFGGGL